MKITAELLLKIAPQGKREICEALANFMNSALPKYQINTPKRVMYFLGQAAEETAGFKTLTEYASGAEYNGRKDLGNTHPGDGVRYKGRGIFQITGRYNYRHFGEKIGQDLENNPDMACDPEIAVLTACEFWNERGLSKYADADDIKGITKHINGGYNGLSDREIFTERAHKNITAIMG